MGKQHTYAKDKAHIASLIEQHYVSLDSLFNNHTISRQGLLLMPVFADFAGLKLESLLAEKQHDQIEAYLREDHTRLDRMDRFKVVIQELRHSFIQQHPQKALEHITKEEISDFVASAFEINNAETLFYNSERNFTQINHIMQTFSGHYFEPESQTIRTHLSDHPEIEVGYPTISFNSIESIDSFISVMKQAIVETDINLTQKRERVIEMMESHKKKATRDQEQER